MSIFQCIKCGVAENTALGLYHNVRRNEVHFDNVPNDMILCCVCAPTHYRNGKPTKFTGQWHDRFHRTFLPKGMCFTNDQGNLEHILDHTSGNELYQLHGRDEEYPDEEE